MPEMHATSMFHNETKSRFRVPEPFSSHFGIPAFSASFDYVIVGGGTAGLTVARRLAADPSVSVAVIEAGDFAAFPNGNLSQVPAYASYFTGNDPIMKNPYLDWLMYTEHQPQLDGKPRLYDSSKVIAGSSARNFLWQIRGTAGCFQKWANEVDNHSYTFENMLSFFRRSYAYTPPQNAERPENSSAGYVAEHWDSSGSPLKVSYVSQLMRSPQLLLVTGVGSEETINKINVSLVADRLGVRQNLWDNMLVGPTFEVDIITHSSLQNPSYLAQSIQEYSKRRNGILTNSGGDIAAFEKFSTGMVSTPTLEA
ncbi:hypothetical protein E0Z10_g1208 [Xylaria hypoxylon]|uniref:FAD dependent oxidoreductase domain-containing protein n=1 Tax=Xylaria hypoxylon TaxID=37992 RepID=A0A4Z0Z9B4_9PEZI|nr:hypothetical protein E0Z10_g1208 [Xylaria hypoxylon]